MKIDRLISAYLKFIGGGIHTEELENNNYEIETPFLDRRNDHISIYAKGIDTDSIILTDNGYTLNDLMLSGLHFETSKRQEELKTLLNGLGIKVNDKKEIYVIASNDTFAYQMHNLIQALISVNDMFVLSKSNVMNIFFDDVLQYFDQNKIRYSYNIAIEGKSHLSHKFDMIIPKSKEAPERTIKAINNPKVENIKSTLFAFEDIGDRKGEGYIILNDIETIINPKIIEAIDICQVCPFLWSKKDEYISRLSA